MDGSLAVGAANMVMCTQYLLHRAAKSYKARLHSALSKEQWRVLCQNSSGTHRR